LASFAVSPTSPQKFPQISSHIDITQAAWCGIDFEAIAIKVDVTSSNDELPH